MPVVYERCAGLDIHQRTGVACLMTPARRAVRTFGTFTHELLALGDRRRAARTWPWKPSGCSGSPWSICWKASATR